jgi:hypothetical protein
MFLTNFVGFDITGVNFLLEPSILQVFPQNSSPTSQPTSRLCLFVCLLYTPWVCHQRPRGKLAVLVVLLVHLHGVLADNTITGAEGARLLLLNSFTFSFVNFVSMFGRKSSLLVKGAGGRERPHSVRIARTTRFEKGVNEGDRRYTFFHFSKDNVNFSRG